MPPDFGRKDPSPLPRPAGGVVRSEPIWEATGGTQTHSRRTGSKLGQLHYARQGLVRVPESNTKYGGKGRNPRPCGGSRCRQVSVSPQGFPSEKNCADAARGGFIPL